jgi:hypothetical protein
MGSANARWDLDAREAGDEHVIAVGNESYCFSTITRPWALRNTW